MRTTCGRVRWLGIGLMVSMILGALVASGCGGGGSTSPAGGGNPGGGTPAGSSTFAPTSTSGTLQLPARATVAPTSLTVTSSMGTSTVGTDGSFSVTTNAAAAQTISAVDSNGDVRLMADANLPGVPPDLSAHSTALALLMALPPFTSTDPVRSGEIRSVLEGLPELAAVETAVNQTLVANQPLDASANLQAAVAAAYAAAEAKFQALSMQSPARPHVQYVTPSGEASYVQVSTLADANASSLKFRVSNYAGRFVEVWTQHLDDDGTPILSENRVGLVPPLTIDAGLGGVWTTITSTLPNLAASIFDYFADPSQGLRSPETPKTADISDSVSDNGQQVDIEAWGMGLQNASNISANDQLSHGSLALVGTVFYCTVGPFLDKKLGIGIKVFSSADLWTENVPFLSDVAADPVVQDNLKALIANPADRIAQLNIVRQEPRRGCEP